MTALDKKVIADEKKKAKEKAEKAKEKEEIAKEKAKKKEERVKEKKDKEQEPEYVLKTTTTQSGRRTKPRNIYGTGFNDNLTFIPYI